MAVTMDTEFVSLDDEDVQRAYEIHGKMYEGEEVSDEEQKFYDKTVSYLFKLAMDTEVDRLGFGLRIWLIYASKYVKEWT